MHLWKTARRHAIVVMACIFAAHLTGSSLARAERPSIEMDLIGEPQLRHGDMAKWLDTLTKLDVINLRISSNPRVKIDIVNIGTERSPAYKVTGLLTSKGILLVPGGKFKVTDRAALGRWLDEIGDGGKEAVTVPKNAFGMTEAQFEEVQKDLSRRVDFSTKGQPSANVVNKIGRLLSLKLAVDPSALGSLGPKTMVGEELEGLSCGTAMAIILRPAGLSLTPRRSDGRNEHFIHAADPKIPPWPVGWPPKKKARELVPGLYEFLNYEIEAVPLTELLDAMTAKLGLRYIQDQNSMVRHRIDIRAAKVTLGEGRSFYAGILSRALIQAKLKYELRIDEAGSPLLWITTIKR